MICSVLENPPSVCGVDQREQSLIIVTYSWFLSLEMFDRLDVPVGGQITGLVVEHDRPGLNYGARPNLTLRVEPQGVEVTDTKTLHLRALVFVSETDGSDLILVDIQSVLGELAELVDNWQEPTRGPRGRRSPGSSSPALLRRFLPSGLPTARR